MTEQVPPQVTPPAPEIPHSTPPEKAPIEGTPIIPALEEKEVEPEVTKVEKTDDGYVIPDDMDLLDPKNAREAIAKTVEAKISVIHNDMTTQRIKSEVKSIIEEHPEYKPYAEKIQKWVTHPNRIDFIKKGFPVKSVVLEALAPHLEKIGAEKARLADAKAKASAGDGVTTPPKVASTKIDFKSMSPKDISDMAERVKSGRM